LDELDLDVGVGGFKGLFDLSHPLDFPYLVAVVHRDDRLGEGGRREARRDEERDDQDGKKTGAS